VKRTVGAFAVAVWLAVAGTAQAAPSSVDPTFGTDGVHQLEFGALGSPDHPAVSAYLAPLGLDAGERLVLAGGTAVQTYCIGHLGCVYESVPSLARLNADGSPDETFGPGGMLEQRLGPQPLYGLVGWALRDGGGLIATRNGPNGVAIRGLTAEGQPDTSFAGGGWQEVPLPNTASGPSGVLPVIQSDGRIVVAAVSSEETSSLNHNLTLLRFEADGTQDLTFGDAGFRQVPMSGVGYGGLSDIALGLDDRIYVATGSAAAVPGNLNAVMAYWRFGPNGDLDVGYGDQGSHEVAVPQLPLFGEQPIAVDSAARLYGLVTTGQAGDAQSVRSGVMRLDSSGETDPEFDDDGVVQVERARITDIGLQNDRLLAAGGAGTALALGRFLENGAPDPSFGTGGWSQVATGLPTLGFASALALPGGRIAAAAGTGPARVSAPCVAVVRFQADGEPAPSSSPEPGECPAFCKPSTLCPTVARKVSVRASKSGVVRGRVSSQRSECVRGAAVQIRRKGPGGAPRIGRDRKLGRVTPNSARYEVELPERARHGVIYAIVKTPAKRPFFGRCITATSRRLKLDRAA
jgi:uncharacterized delta-60 repeat protein